MRRNAYISFFGFAICALAFGNAFAQTAGEKALKTKDWNLANSLLTNECNANQFASCVALGELFSSYGYDGKDPNKSYEYNKKRATANTIPVAMPLA